VIFAALVGAWLLFCFVVIAHPRATHRPKPADAIMVLGPSIDSRVSTALSLAATLRISQIVISVGDTSGQTSQGPCARPPSGITVTCFQPEPYTTQGEARELGRLAAEHHWTSVIVITATPHISRSHMIIKRCYGGSVQMVRDPAPISIGKWAYQFLYQSAAFGKALLRSGC
jgi:uncharacterized SAM-binding protein YcdF (DUF218 family)